MVEMKSQKAGRETGPRRPQRRWSADERHYIFTHYESEPVAEIAQRFKVNTRTIITMQCRMRKAEAQGVIEPWKVKRDLKMIP